MRKILLLLSVWLLCVGTARSQSFIHFGLNGHFGPSFILNLKSAYNGDYNPEPKASFTYGGGASVGFNFIQYLGVQTGVLYQVQGQNMDYTVRSFAKETILTIQHQYSYLKVPALLRINTTPNESVMFTFLGGVQFGWLMGLNSVPPDKADLAGIDFPVPNPFIDKSLYRSPAMEAVAELGIDFFVGPLVIGIHLRGEYALSDVFKTTYIPNKPLQNLAGGLVLGLSYFLPFSEKNQFKHTRRWF